MTEATVIYLVAGVCFCWALPGRWWQRVAMIVVWLPMMAWGMFVEASDWWANRGYQYEDGNGPDESRPPGD
jgi:nitrogen fixation-related uncharacterized protein